MAIFGMDDAIRYKYMYVCMYVCIHICIHIYIYIYICIYERQYSQILMNLNFIDPQTRVLNYF